MASQTILTPTQIHPLCKKPDLAWQEIKKTQTKCKVNPLPLKTPVYPDKIRFVCLSDTHCRTMKPEYVIPPGDVLLHAGDFTKVGTVKEVVKFNQFLDKLPHPHKVVISGNHEECMDKESSPFKYDENAESLLTNCIYLLDSSVTLFGIKIYGSPWTPPHCTRAFARTRGNASLMHWNLIPDDTDVLMTHGPPVGYGDKINSGYRVGCTELLHVVQERVKPTVHLFGHVHEGYGVWSDGTTMFINASTCDKCYRPIQPPVIFDLALPEGFSKSLSSPSDSEHLDLSNSIPTELCSKNLDLKDDRQTEIPHDEESVDISETINNLSLDNHVK